MYDANNRESFERVENWLANVDQAVDTSVERVLVCNKVDLPREVSTEEGEAYARKLKMRYFETSAFTGQGIEACINYLVSRIIVTKIAESEPDHCRAILAGTVPFSRDEDAEPVEIPDIKLPDANPGLNSSGSSNGRPEGSFKSDNNPAGPRTTVKLESKKATEKPKKKKCC